MYVMCYTGVIVEHFIRSDWTEMLMHLMTWIPNGLGFVANEFLLHTSVENVERKFLVIIVHRLVFEVRSMLSGYRKDVAGALDVECLLASLQALDSMLLSLQDATADAHIFEDNCNLFRDLTNIFDEVLKCDIVTSCKTLYACMCRLRARIGVGLLQLSDDTCLDTQEFHMEECLVESDGTLSGCRQDVMQAVTCLTTFVHDSQQIENLSFGQQSAASMVAWIIADTLFCNGQCNERLPTISASASPVSFTALLCQLILNFESLPSGISDKGGLTYRYIQYELFWLSWDLLSRISERENQKAVLGWYYSRVRQTYTSSVMNSYPLSGWIERETSILVSRGALDERKSRGIVIGETIESQMKASIQLFFPAVVLCPYRLLQKLVHLGAFSVNGRALLKGICNAFPILMKLVPKDVDQGRDDQLHEIERLLIEEVCRSSLDGHAALSLQDFILDLSGQLTISPHNDEPGYTIVRPKNFLENGVIPILSSPHADGVIAASTVRRMFGACTEKDLISWADAISKSSDESMPWICQVLQTCLRYLEFDSRYAAHNMRAGVHEEPLRSPCRQYYDRDALEQIREIVFWIFESLLYADPDASYSALSMMEYQGFPWTRLYCGSHFTEYEVHYILYVNPKVGLDPGNAFGIQDVTIHHALELSAMGCVDASIINRLCTEKPFEDFRNDLMKSLRCLCLVCTSTEVFNLFTCVEHIASNFILKTEDIVHQALDVPLMQARCKAMTIEVFLTCIIDDLTDAESSQGESEHVWEGLMNDIGRYCLDSVPKFSLTVQAILGLRFFSDLLMFYEKLLPLGQINCSGIEATMSSLVRHLISHKELPSALRDMARDKIAEISQDKIEGTSYGHALSELLRSDN